MGSFLAAGASAGYHYRHSKLQGLGTQSVIIVQQSSCKFKQSHPKDQKIALTKIIQMPSIKTPRLGDQPQKHRR